VNLPEIAYIDNSRRIYAGIPGHGVPPVIAVKRGESGYYPIYTHLTADELNKGKVTPPQREAMLIGSMFGWDVPGANPDHYDENGQMVKA
jgi:hypothetical protein